MTLDVSTVAGHGAVLAVLLLQEETTFVTPCLLFLYREHLKNGVFSQTKEFGP